MVTTGESITRSDLHEALMHYATKEDLAQMETRLIKWMVGMMLGTAAVAGTIGTIIARFVV